MKQIFLLLLLLLAGRNIRAQEQHILTSDSVDLFVSVKGKGTPCLFIHGGPGSGSYWVEKFFGRELEQHFKMIYLDQRGVGRSKSPKSGDYSMNRMVQDFEEVRTALGIKKWLIMGHSFGGILQMGYADRHADAIAGMIMINCTLDMTESLSKAWLPQACKFLNLPRENAYTNDSIPLLDRLNDIITQLNKQDLFWKMAFKYKENSAKLDATYQEIPDWNSDLSQHAMSIKEYWNDYKPLAAKMKMPVLFFTGKHDWMAGPENYKGVKFPKMMRFKSDVGHIPFLENQQDLEKALTKYCSKYKF